MFRPPGRVKISTAQFVLQVLAKSPDWFVRHSWTCFCPNKYAFHLTVWRYRDSVRWSHGDLHHHEPWLCRPYRAPWECQSSLQTCSVYCSWFTTDLRDHAFLWRILNGQGNQRKDLVWHFWKGLASAILGKFQHFTEISRWQVETVKEHTKIKNAKGGTNVWLGKI